MHGKILHRCTKKNYLRLFTLKIDRNYNRFNLKLFLIFHQGQGRWIFFHLNSILIITIDTYILVL